ncbi:hypothetical protein H1R20_g11038, partial [Candolleomyces eurysporus]
MSSFSSMEIPASSSHVYERDRYSDEPTGEVEADESSSKPFQFKSSPPTSLGDEFYQSRLRWSHEHPDRDIVGVEHSNGQAKDAANLSDSRPSSSNTIYCPEYWNEFDERGLPSFIRFPDSSEEYGLSSVYGTLFLHSDPWNVIGDILDRGEQSLNYDYDMGRVGRMAEDANMESSGNEYTSSFMCTRSDSESQDEDEGQAAQESPSIFGLDLDPFEGLGGQEESIEFEEGPSDVEMGDGEFSSLMKRGSPTAKRHSNHLGLSQAYLPEQFVIQQQHTHAHPTAPAPPEMYQMDGSDVQVDDFQTDNGDGIEGPSLGPNPSGMETDDVRLDPVEIESLLDMPELEEIGGRYVGPSLFSNEPDDDDCCAGDMWEGESWEKSVRVAQLTASFCNTTQHLTTNIHDPKPRCGHRSCPEDTLKRPQALKHKLSASSKHVLNTNSATCWFKGYRIDCPSKCWSNRQRYSNAGHDG